MGDYQEGDPQVEPVNEVGWLMVMVVCGGVAGIAILLIGAVWHCVAKKGKKKKHNFGVKKLRNTEKTFLNFKKTSPVTNPDRGSHYLKKSPSPTGTKSPPGCEPNNETSLSPCEEYINRRPLVPSP